MKAKLYQGRRTETVYGPFDAPTIGMVGISNDMIDKIEVSFYTESTEESFVSIYEEVNFGGRAHTFSTKDGEIDCIHFNTMFFVDKTRSMEVGPGAEVILYDNCFENS
jgi:hypothetical protein